MIVPRRVAACIACAAVGLLPALAHAQTKKACADAYIAGQVARKDGRLRDARAQFDVCGAAACPATLQTDCKPWRDQVDRDIPKILVEVTDGAGAPVVATVTIDGAAPASGPVSLDPGDHVVRAEVSGQPAVEERVTLTAGQGRRTVSLRVGRAASSTAPVAASRPFPVGPVVLGATGLVALGIFAGLGAAGSSKKSSLDASGCKPDCSASDVSSARSLYLGADVSLGIGLAAVAAAAVWLGVSLSGAPPAATQALTFSPSRGGGDFTFHF